MSKNESNNAAVVTGIVTGIGALFGIGYYLWNTFNNNNNHGESPHGGNQRPPDGGETPQPRNCVICDGEKNGEETFTLHCNHTFHTLCLKANLILHIGEKYFVCPIRDCKEVITQEEFNNIFK